MIPVICIGGPGGSGKDQFAQYLCEAAGLPMQISTSRFMADTFWAEVLSGQSEYFSPLQFNSFDEFYAGRRVNRDKWARWIAEYNMSDGSGIRMYKEMVEQGQRILVGIRRREEFFLVVNGLADLSVWIRRDNHDEDPTITYTEDDCDVIVCNNGDLAALRSKATRIVNCFSLQAKA
jgi:hypothetical protein